MTAEIGILNREAVALAADSAVTSGDKIFPSANKIFTLSKYAPVGLMVYGSAGFMDVPWETVVKEYRSQLGRSTFGKVEQYADDFLDYLCRDSRLAPAKRQKSYAIQLIIEEFNFLRGAVDEIMETVLGAERNVTPEEAKDYTDSVIKNRFRAWKKAPYPDHFPDELRKRIRNDYIDDVRRAKKHFFPSLLTSAASRRLTEIAVQVITKITPERGNNSGVVVAGFGEDEIYPRLYEFSVQGVIEGHLKYREARSTEIEPVENPAVVMAFAQGEMVSLFMEGIDPSYRKLIEEFIQSVITGFPEAIADTLEDALGEDKAGKLKEKIAAVSRELIKKYDQELRAKREDSYVQPIISVIRMLPKGELAAAARALVNLTSFKRRVSRQAETVGGPIDVAVISKGDGFIWIDRKHYFDADLNHHFFSTYYPPEDDDNDEE